MSLCKPTMTADPEDTIHQGVGGCSYYGRSATDGTRARCCLKDREADGELNIPRNKYRVLCIAATLGDVLRLCSSSPRWIPHRHGGGARGRQSSTKREHRWV